MLTKMQFFWLRDFVLKVNTYQLTLNFIQLFYLLYLVNSGNRRKFIFACYLLLSLWSSKRSILAIEQKRSLHSQVQIFIGQMCIRVEAVSNFIKILSFIFLYIVDTLISSFCFLYQAILRLKTYFAAIKRPEAKKTWISYVRIMV